MCGVRGDRDGECVARGVRGGGRWGVCGERSEGEGDGECVKRGVRGREMGSMWREE